MTTDETYTGWRTVQSSRTREMIRVSARQMGDLVRSTLGPLGLDKMVVRRMEDDEIRGFVSNDGVAIIEEFEGETDHPIANRFIGLAEDHEDDLGDGTTTTVLLAADLLSTGMDLADRGVHPNDVIEGFSIGAQRTLECWDQAAIPLVADGELDREALRSIAMTGMTNGRAGAWPLADVADTVVEAVLRVSDPASGTTRLDHAQTVAVPGGEVGDTHVFDGALVADSVVTAEHLLPVEGPVLLVRGALESRSLSTDVTVDIGDREAAGRTAADAFDDSEEIAAAIAASGAVAVLATGDVEWAVAEELARHGVVLLRNVMDWHFEYVAAATGATPRGPVTPDSAVAPDKLGYATVGVRSTDPGGDDDWIEFRAPPDADVDATALVVRGGIESTAEEAERRVKDGKNALRACIRHPAALPAGGAADLQAAAAVRSLATRFDGREQLAVDAFADVLEAIPKTLARNAGRGPLEALAELRTRHDAGHSRAGLDSDGEVVDDVTADGGGLDAFQVRASGLVRAVEFANNLMRIDSMLVDRRDPSVDRVLEEPGVGPGEVPEPGPDA